MKISAIVVHNNMNFAVNDLDLIQTRFFTITKLFR
jgi:hypothetical protein